MRFLFSILYLYMVRNGKNDFAEVSTDLARYRWK